MQDRLDPSCLRSLTALHGQLSHRLDNPVRIASKPPLSCLCLPSRQVGELLSLHSVEILPGDPRPLGDRLPVKYHCPKTWVFACGSFSDPYASQFAATVGALGKFIRSKLNLANIRELSAWSLT